MKNSTYLHKLAIAVAATALLLTGCESKENKAIDVAKQQAIATGQPQQVVTTDSSGKTTTVTVTPPASGQTQPTITTTVTPSTGAAGTVQPQAPVVEPVAVNVAAGTMLTIRIDQHISVKDTPAGTHFSGEVVTPVAGDNNQVVIPGNTHVEGIVDESHRRGHFKGSSILELRLTEMTLQGKEYSLDTHDLTRSKKGKGKRSAAMIGGGAGLGMLVGGVATGGVGLVVGGLVGGGLGTAAAGLTGNRDINIPAESIVHFKLADDLVIS